MYQLSRSKRDVLRIFAKSSFEDIKTPQIEPIVKEKREPVYREPISLISEEPVIKKESVIKKELVYREPITKEEEEQEEEEQEEEEQEEEEQEEEEQEEEEQEEEEQEEEEQEQEEQEEDTDLLEKIKEKEIVEKELAELIHEKDIAEKELSEILKETEEAKSKMIIEEEPKEEEKEEDFFAEEEAEEEEAEEAVEEAVEEPEEEPEEEAPITIYDYDDESYYIDNTPFLQKTFLFKDGSHPMNLCIYTCIRNGCMPYLMYLTVYDKSKNTLVLPSAESIVVVPEDSDDDIRSRTMENFQQSLFQIFQPNESEETTEDVFYPHLFKGLFLNSDDDITMVYDATRVQVPVATDKEYFWVTPYEILVLYQYRNIKIDDSVLLFFQTIATSSGFIDKSFYQLKRVSNGSLVPVPYVLFPCIRSYLTLFSKYENPISTTYKTKTKEQILIPTIDHPKIGNFPMFSALPLDSSVPHIQRCAVFVDIDDLEPTFIMEENSPVLDHLYDIDNPKQYSSISFLENGIQYWMIKSPLYFSEIYDDRESFIPMTTFTEVNADELVVEEPKEEVYEKEAEVEQEESEEDMSNEGSEISNEGSEISNEGDETSDEEYSDQEESDEDK